MKELYSLQEVKDEKSFTLYVQTEKELCCLQEVMDEKSFTLYKISRMRKASLFTRGRG